MRDSGFWIKRLKMLPHPEGGFFKETYRSEEVARREHLPDRFSGERNFSTSIYYLLENNQVSKLHRIKSDEMWHFYDGCGLVIYSIDSKGDLNENKLGLNPDQHESPQVLVKAGDWFGAKVSKPDSFCLAGCTVSPGFHFDDFEMGDRNYLLDTFPEHEEIICKLT
jgi:predicted cupin superfamily sugar epimerase